jgi:cold shock CspA family protein
MIAYVDENGMITDSPPDSTRKSTTKANEIEVSVPKQDPGDPSSKSRTGKLAFFNETKGYGFINESVTGQSIFVHASDFLDEINKGDTVSFKIGKGQRGPSAFEVRLQK